MKVRIDTQTLLKEAEKTPTQEAFRVVRRSQSFRIGVGVRAEPPDPTSFFLEVLFRFCSEQGTLDLNLLERNLTVLKQLDNRGYSLKCEEGGGISCELQLQEQRLVQELEAVDALLTGYSARDAVSLVRHL